MNRNLLTLVSALTFTLAGSTIAIAKDVQKHVIALKTDDFELVETDISDLEVGEARTIVTEEGKNIDIIRAAEGVEIYVDGELLDLSFGDMSGAHKRHQRIVVDCDGAEGECGDLMALHSGDGDHAAGDHEVLVRQIHVSCTADDESECAEKVWVSSEDSAAFGDVEIEKLIDSDGGVRIIHMGGEHDPDFEGTELHETHEVIVVREKSED